MPYVVNSFSLRIPLRLNCWPVVSEVFQCENRIYPIASDQPFPIRSANGQWIRIASVSDWNRGHIFVAERPQSPAPDRRRDECRERSDQASGVTTGRG